MTKTNNTLSVLDSPPTPREAELRDNGDPLRPAKGILSGVLLGIVCWFALIGLFLVLS